MQEREKNACRFCELAANSSPAESHDVPWLESEEHFALASVGALVEGWSLIVPRTHTMNMGAEYKKATTQDFIRTAIARLQARYGPVVLFEHGCARSNSPTGCGVDHAHLHLVPIELDIEGAAREFDASLKWRAVYMTGLEEESNGREYLFASTHFQGASTTGVISTLESGISQFFRRVIARSLGCDDQYNYRMFPEYERASSARSTLASPDGIRPASAAGRRM